MAIAYEQNRKLSEHVNQEAPCPSFCQVGATEVSIGQHHVFGSMGTQLGECAMYVYDAVEVIALGQGWGSVDVGCLREVIVVLELLAGFFEEQVKVRGDKSYSFGFTK